MKGVNAVIDRLKQRRTEEGGFTLIELLIVIIVLGILAAIVIFAIGSTKSDSVTASCKTDAKAIELSLEAQNTSTGLYPAAPGGANANLISPAAGAILKTWPGGTNYTFSYAGVADGSSYTVTIGAAGGSGIVGGNFTNTSDTGIAAACHK